MKSVQVFEGNGRDHQCQHQVPIIPPPFRLGRRILDPLEQQSTLIIWMSLPGRLDEKPYCSGGTKSRLDWSETVRGAKVFPSIQAAVDFALQIWGPPLPSPAFFALKKYPRRLITDTLERV